MILCCDRWEVIATYVTDHSPDDRPKTAKQVSHARDGVLVVVPCAQVIQKVKSLQKLEAAQRQAENSQAFQAFQQTHSSRTSVEATPTERYGTNLSS